MSIAAANPDAVLAATGEGAKAGPIGLAVILLLCIACYFLFKSMSKHMRRVRENFPAEPTAQPPVKPSVEPEQPEQPTQPGASSPADHSPQS